MCRLMVGGDSGGGRRSRLKKHPGQSLIHRLFAVVWADPVAVTMERDCFQSERMSSTAMMALRVEEKGG